MYSHEVIDNPVSAEGNHSGKVLEICLYGSTQLRIEISLWHAYLHDDLKVVEFMIYQPLNVIGKETDGGKTGRETTSASNCFQIQYNEWSYTGRGHTSQ